VSIHVAERAEQSRPAARRQPARHAIVEEAEHFDIEPWRGDNTLRELLAELRRAADDDFPARISSRARSMNDARCGNLTEPQQDRRGDGPSDQYAPIEALREACDLEQCPRSEEHTSELQSRENLVCRLLLEKKKNT